MPTHQSWVKFDEVPLRRGCFYGVVCIDTHSVENLGQLVHKGDVHVSLRVLDDLRGLGHAYRRSLMRTIYQHRIVNSVNDISNLRRRTRSNFLNLLNRVFLVTRIDTLGRVACIEIGVKLQARDLLNHGQAFLFGNTRVNSRFVNNDVTFRDNFTHRGACSDKRCQVRAIVHVYGRRHSNHIEVAAA